MPPKSQAEQKKAQRQREENELATEDDALPGETKADRRRRLERERKRQSRSEKKATATPSSRIRPSSGRVQHIKIERNEDTDDDMDEGSVEDDKSAVWRNPIVKFLKSEPNDAEYTPDDDGNYSDELHHVAKTTPRKRRRTSTRSKSASSIDNRTNPGRRRFASAKKLKLESIRKRIKRQEEETLAYDGPDLDSIPGETWADYRRRKDRERVKKKRALWKSMQNLSQENNESGTHPPDGLSPSTSRPLVSYTPREKAVRSIRHEVDRLITTETEKKWDPRSKKWKKNRPQNLEDVSPEAAEDWLFKEMLIHKLHLEFEQVRWAFIAEAVELELGPCVPSLERPVTPAQGQTSNNPADDETSDSDQARNYNEDINSSTSQHDGSAYNPLEVIMIKPEPVDMDQDDNEMQEWIANAVSAADDEHDDMTNFHATSGYQPKNRILNIRKQERASQLESQLESCRARWVEEKPDDTESRDLVDIERQSLIDQVILEKKELIKQTEIWLSQKRELYSNESLPERTARIAARLKDNEPQSKQATRVEKTSSTPRATSTILLTPEERKVRHAEFSRIRCRMEKKEYEIHVRLVATQNPTEFANTLTHPDHQVVIQYWSSAAESSRVKVREEIINYRKMLGKFLTLTKTSKISYNSSSSALQVVESSATTNFKEFHTFLGEFGPIVAKHLEDRRFYMTRRAKKYNELSLEARFKENLRRKEWKAKRRTGGVISEEYRAKFDAEWAAGAVAWEAKMRERAFKKQLKEVNKAIKGTRRRRRKKSPSTSMAALSVPSRKKTTSHAKPSASLLPTYLPPQRQSRYHADNDSDDDWTPNAGSYSPPSQDDDNYLSQNQYVQQQHQEQHHTHQHFMGAASPARYELGQVQVDGWVALSTAQHGYHHEQINSSYPSTSGSYQQHLSTINTTDWSSHVTYRNTADAYLSSSQPKNTKRKPGRPRGSSSKSRSTKLVKDSLKRCRRTHPPNTDFWGNRARKERKAQKATLGPPPPVEPLPPETICPLERSVQKMLETKLPENVANLCPKCPHCDKVFSEESGFKSHLKKRHPELELDKKKTTDKKSNNKKKPKPSYHSKEKFICPICDFVYTDRGRLLEHLYSNHWVKNEVKWVCPFSARVGKQVDLKCNNLQFGMINLSNHFKRKHPDAMKQWYLTFDSRRTTGRSSLFVCLECDHDCKSFSSLIDHYASTHDHLRWGCEHCGVLLRRRDQLDDHVALFHPHDHPGIENPKSGAPLDTSSLNIHKCATCLSEFSSLEWMQSHVNKGHRFIADEEGAGNAEPEECDTSRTCFWCRKEFKPRSELVDHIDKCHPNEPPVSKAMEPEMYHCAEPYKCELCIKSFLTLARLRKHCFEDHDLSKYVELVKEKVPPSTSNHSHQEEQHASTSTKHVTPTLPSSSSSLCQLCHFTTSHSFHQVHLVYDQVMKRYCQICHRMFTSKAMMILHMNAVHSIPLDALVIPSASGIIDDATLHDPNDPHISCPGCPKIFTASQFHHYHSFHAEGIWPCPQCPSIFITREMRLKHVKDEHNPDKKVITPEILESLIHATEVEHSGKSVTIYTCKVCMKNYKTKEYVVTHIRDAHKNNAFTRVMCPQCNTTFQYAHSLRNHIIVAHSEEGMKRFKCPACPKTITTMGQMRRHVQKYHTEINFDPGKIETVNIAQEGLKNGKRFLCNICTQDFSTEDGLKSHITGKHFPIHFTTFCDHCGLQISQKRKKWHMWKSHDVPINKRHDVTKTNKAKTQVTSVFELLEIVQKIYAKVSFATRNRKRTRVAREEEESSESDEGQNSEDEDDNDQSFDGSSDGEDTKRKSLRRSARTTRTAKSSVYYIDESSLDDKDESEFSHMSDSDDSDEDQVSLKKLFINPNKKKRRGEMSSSNS